MFLAIDIGNTNIVAGLFPAAKKKGTGLPAVSWRMATDARRTADEYGALLVTLFRQSGHEPAHVRGVAVASVVPPLDQTFQDLSLQVFRIKPLFIGPEVNTGVRVLYDHPHEVGADRVVNAAAAYARLKRACIVVDFGTATTFDCVSARGEYIGGVIAPGPAMAAQALAEKTAKLPFLGTFRAPRRAIGRNTVDSIASGLFHGYVGLTQEILGRLKAEMGANTPVLATGGFAGLMRPAVKGIQQVVPHLTLEGLRLIWQRNR